MVIGILQFELLIHGALSLKDKRRVVRSAKDRLHREHQCSVAEVGALDVPTRAMLGLALVGADGAHVGKTLDRITLKLRALPDAELGDVRREILTPQGGWEDPGSSEADPGGGEAIVDHELERELIEHFDRQRGGRTA